MGGGGQHTDEVVQMMEAAGYGVVLVETVGVGQSEILVTEARIIIIIIIISSSSTFTSTITITTTVIITKDYCNYYY